MKTRLHPATYGTCALAVAALLASPSFADASSRQGTHGGHDKTVSPSRSSSRSGGSTSSQRSDHGGSGRSYEAPRHYGESHQERPQISAPRSLPPRLPDSRPAPQQHSWTRPDNDAHRPAYSNPFQQRPSAPAETGQRWHGHREPAARRPQRLADDAEDRAARGQRSLLRPRHEARQRNLWRPQPALRRRRRRARRPGHFPAL